MQKTGILLTMITMLIILIGCSETQHKATTEVIDGVTYVHNVDIPFTDLKLEPELTITGDDYYEYMGSPEYVNVDLHGNIFLTDPFANTITKFSASGDFIATIKAEGEAPGEFGIMGRMDIFPNGDVIIADLRNYRYQLLDKNFKYIKSFKFDEPIPYNCVVLNGNELVVNGATSGMQVEKGTALLKAYNRDLDFIWQSDNQIVREQLSAVFYSPGYYSLAHNSKGKIIVAAYLDNSISIFNNGMKELIIDRALPYQSNIKAKSTIRKVKGGYVAENTIQPVSIAVSSDNGDNIYVLRFPDKSETKDENLEKGEFLAILEIYNPEGILFKKSKIKGASASSDMKIDHNDNFYLLNYNEDGNVLTRYKPLEI